MVDLEIAWGAVAVRTVAAAGHELGQSRARRRAGRVTEMDSGGGHELRCRGSRCTRPLTTRPEPRQREQVRSTAMGKMPCWKRTRPRPLHAPAARPRDGPSGGAGAAARRARDHALVAHRLLAPEGGLFLERDLEPALDVALVAPADPEDPEQVAQDAVDGDVADVDVAAREGASAAEGGAGGLGAVAEAVVHRAAALVAQHLVGEVDLLEALVDGRVVRVAVGVPRDRQLLEGALDFVGRRVATHPENLVVVPR